MGKDKIMDVIEFSLAGEGGGEDDGEGENKNTIDMERKDKNGQIQSRVLTVQVRQGMVNRPWHNLVLPTIPSLFALCPLPRLQLHMQQDNRLMAQMFLCHTFMLLTKRGAIKASNFTKGLHFTSTRRDFHLLLSNHTSIHGLHLLLVCA
jgi:hypothetical protein